MILYIKEVIYNIYIKLLFLYILKFKKNCLIYTNINNYKMILSLLYNIFE